MLLTETRNALFINVSLRLGLPGNQEVSAFGSDDNSDSGDSWEVECASSQARYWQRDENIRLKHVDTNA